MSRSTKRETIMLFAAEAGLGQYTADAHGTPVTWAGTDLEALERFFETARNFASMRELELMGKLVDVAAAVAAEREACAQVAEDGDHEVEGRGYYQQGGDARATMRNIATAIRARGAA